MLQSIKGPEKSIKQSESICNELNEHCVTIGEKLSDNVKNATEQVFKRFKGKQQTSSIVLRPTDEHEVIKILAGQSNNKSPGCHDISVTLLKGSKFVVARYISKLLNKHITNDTFPDNLKVEEHLSQS